MTAAELAAILDTEHQQKYWWTYWKDWIYYGPPDLHTAREHAWRMEEWLEARGYGWRRNWFSTDMTVVVSPNSQTRETETLARDPNHAAALVAAIERINNEVR